MKVTGELSIKRILLFVTISIAVPIFLLVSVFIIPEPLSWPIIKSASWIIQLIPIDTDTYRSLTLYVFGRLTPNYAPIQIVVLSILCFITTFLILVIYNHVSKATKNA